MRTLQNCAARIRRAKCGASPLAAKNEFVRHAFKQHWWKEPGAFRSPLARLWKLQGRERPS